VESIPILLRFFSRFCAEFKFLSCPEKLKNKEPLLNWIGGHRNLVCAKNREFNNKNYN